MLSRPLTRIAAVAAVTAAVVRPLGAADDSLDQRIQLIQSLMHGAYPEFAEQRPELTIYLSPDYGSEWRTTGFIDLTVTPHERSSHAAQQPSGKRYFAAFFAVAGSVIHRAQFLGDYVKEGEREAVAAFIRPDMSEAEVQEVMLSRGARFGPSQRDAFLAQLDIARFEPALGAIREVDVENSWHVARRAGLKHDGEPLWIVKVESRGPHGQPLCYSMSFESFSGLLIGVTSRECRP